MTTTPAPTHLDLDAIRARLLNAIDGPWAIWPDLRPGGLITIGDATGVIPEGETWTEGPSNTVAHVYTDEDADFIVHAPEDIRALLDELATERRQGAAMASITGEAIRQIAEERDAAREELANTQARVATLDERVTTWKTRLVEETATLREELAKTRTELDAAHVAITKVRDHIARHWDWENPSSDCEVGDCNCLRFARDTLAAVRQPRADRAEAVLPYSGATPAEALAAPAAPEASPATTAEPADEQPITARWPRIPGNDTVALHDCGGDPKCCGTPGDHDDAEPATTVHGYTAHGHPCCGEAAVGSRPAGRARCGGTHMCRDCQAAAGRIHGNPVRRELLATPAQVQP